MNKFLDKINEAKKDNTIIVSFLSYNYFPVFERWYEHFKKHNLNNLFIFSLDPETKEKLTSIGVKTDLIEDFHFKEDSGHSAMGLLERKRPLWKVRVKLFKEIINNGTNLIATDLDAFWLKNPISLIDFSFDMVFSSVLNTGQVRNTHQKCNKETFTLCCGFMFVKASNPSVKILDTWEKYCENKENAKFFDDQIAFNIMLNEHSRTWTQNSDGTHSCVSDDFKITIKTMDYRNAYRAKSINEKFNFNHLSVDSDHHHDNIYIYHPFYPDINIFLNHLRETS